MTKFFDLINKNIIRDLRNSGAFVKKSKKKLPIITISRENGSGGKLIAGFVAKKLGHPWRVYNRTIVKEIAKKTSLKRKLIREIDEKQISTIRELVYQFFGNRYPTLNNYSKNLVKILTIISKRGSAIILGRGANFILPQALKIRIICQMKQRIKWLTEIDGLTRKEAIENIRKNDTERKEFVKALYNHDLRKSHHYDLVIRTGEKLSVEDAGNLIVAVAKKRFSL